MRTRKIYFELKNNSFVEIDFGTYSLMMYYSTQIDNQRNKKVFDATLSEWAYRVSYNISEGIYTSDNDIAHFVPADIQEAINFIDSQVIPTLENEFFNSILQKYGGQNNFENTVYYQSTEYLKILSIGGEFYDDNKEVLKYYFIELRNLFQNALNLNMPFETWVD
ncbi:hypothetical protein [Chryseobacterium gallinarum]|uniref:Uncharacterized protein n=1 Tax=Chryseobacterium gallinarum TaxID=1324352 RepID=A0A0G3LY32_CHRGL|nr:hypothetical protein [Chryseobacterium gallinarum]AKK71504.1 hypothetical protein OK18_01595 [Chryseobacterium gallinarum]MCL8538808.1 hypothetical protein [Chryseobacterium gallinarum]QIY89241.1 hypothetical protein FOB44_00640 [Chryseobacterium gallinarum]